MRYSLPEAVLGKPWVDQIDPDADHYTSIMGELSRHYGGRTCEEVELSTGREHQSVSANLRRLRVAGFVTDTGDKRPTTSGRMATVWTISPHLT